MKKCPYCKEEEIQDDAVRCKHCNKVMAKIIWKIIGILLILCGIAIVIYFVFGSMDMIKNAKPADNVVQGIIVAFIMLLIPAVLLIGLGAGAISYKKEDRIATENPSNPLICHNCNRDYDKTWKVCLKCGKPLVKK